MSSDAETAPRPAPAARSVREKTLLAGRYELHALVGWGGSGNVYRAYDRELDEIVALKMLRPTSGASDVVRLRQEAKLARKVTHPNVVRTFDIGEHQGARFITMELVDGESLSTRLSRVGALHPDLAIAIAVGMLRGLVAAHQKGVIHRDLKPGNVLLAQEPPPDGVKITDFGIASTEAMRGAPEVVGTPAYIAPESITGTPPDARSDLYAFGLILYEMLTGERAFESRSFETALEERHERGTLDILTVVRDAGERMARIIRECTALDPEERPESAAVVLATLERAAIDAPPSVQRPPEVRATVTRRTPIAVLSLAASELDRSIADGLGEDLVAALSRYPALAVCARSKIDEARDVPVVVTGDVQRDGDEIVVGLRLVSVADGFQLWSQRFRRPLREVLSLAAEVARDAVTVLDEHGRASTDSASINPEAAELYLEARSQLQRRFYDGTVRAIMLLERARTIEPHEPRILSAHAYALAERFAFMWSGDADIDHAEAAVTEALRLAPDLADPWRSRCRVDQALGRAVDAATAIARAVKLAPWSGEIQFEAGELLSATGDPRGIQILKTAIDLDPRLWVCRYFLASRFALEGDWARCEALAGEPPAEAERGKA